MQEIIRKIIRNADKKIILAGLGLIILFWILESILHSIIFYEHSFGQCLFTTDPHEIWMRLLVIFILITFSIYAHIIITKRKRAEEAAKFAYAELNQVFNTAADGMRIIDKDFNIIRINDTFPSLASISKDEAIGKKCYEVFRGSACHTPDCPMVQILGGKERIEFDVDKQRNDGKIIPCILTATPFRDLSGELIGIVEDFKDISERKKVEREVKDLKKQIEFILGATKTGIDIIDSEFNIRYIDPEWQKVYGDPSGKKCYKYFMDRNEVCSGCGIPKALETKTITVTEEILVKEGIRPIQVITIPFQTDSGEWLVAEVNVDITERKRIEEELKKAKEDLEIKVTDRTAELNKANEQLQKELNERKRAEQELQQTHEKLKEQIAENERRESHYSAC